MLVDRGEKQVSSFTLTKYDLATTYLGIVSTEGDILFPGAAAHSGPRPPHCRDFTIKLKHTACGRTPLDE
jgi:hypothetical protein